MLHRPPVFFPHFQWFPFVSTADVGLHVHEPVGSCVSVAQYGRLKDVQAVRVARHGCTALISTDTWRLRGVLEAGAGDVVGRSDHTAVVRKQFAMSALHMTVSGVP